MAVAANTPISLIDQVYGRLPERAELGRKRAAQACNQLVWPPVNVGHARPDRVRVAERDVHAGAPRAVGLLDPDRVALLEER